MGRLKNKRPLVPLLLVLKLLRAAKNRNLDALYIYFSIRFDD